MISAGQNPSPSVTDPDPLSRAWTAFPDYYEIFGRLEIGLTLDHFSKQMTSVVDWSDEELNTRLNTTYYPEAVKIIKFFGEEATGRIMQYQGRRGYDPERVREISRSFCPPSDFDGPRSELLRAHNMGEYGSGGLPDSMGMRNDFRTELMSSALDIEREARRYTRPEYAGHTGPFLALIQECRARSVDFGVLAWCRAAISIQMCQTFSTLSPESWAEWPLKRRNMPSVNQSTV
ncbi:hypothetical protein BGZ97_006163 [Linnemannia gamsii]|uniref:Uncharacterized protein n=1 Tax=Linnemannia gamsii TaxID=64522 RepID=A0A9P6RDZ7_9FUNG|nr:hypothetical protein BGZ97_006163 [Linnemannia gamsii]